MPACACHQHLVGNVSITRGDPTRTLGISRRFINDIRRRVKLLMADINDFIVIKDALALEEDEIDLANLVERREFVFRTDAGKLEAFNDWLNTQQQARILTLQPNNGKPFSTQYVESAYRRGHLNAYLSSKQAELFDELGVGQQSAEEFLRSAFLQPETLSKIQLLGTRSFEELKGFNAAMAQELNRILAQGIAEGRNPRQVARTMRESITSLTRRRAETIARTEIINAHAEGQLDAFSRLGVDELGVVAEWSTAGDRRVCPACESMEGETFSIEEARGLIPLHPNCRCTWIPSTKQAKNRPRTEPASAPRPRPAAPVGVAPSSNIDARYARSGSSSLDNRMKATLAAADKAHRLPKLPPERKARYSKTIRASRGANGTYSPFSRRVSLNASANAGTGAHEYGHFIDYEILGTGNTSGFNLAIHGRLKEKRLLDVLQRLSQHLHQTESYKSLRNKAHKAALKPRYIRYLMTNHETFARAYSQYVAEKSQSAPMIKYFKQIKDDHFKFSFGAQWTREEMEEIVPLFDELFETLLKTGASKR